MCADLDPGDHALFSSAYVKQIAERVEACWSELSPSVLRSYGFIYGIATVSTLFAQGECVATCSQRLSKARRKS
jgi:hypothetical protein